MFWCGVCCANVLCCSNVLVWCVLFKCTGVVYAVQMYCCTIWRLRHSRVFEQFSQNAEDMDVKEVVAYMEKEKQLLHDQLLLTKDDVARAKAMRDLAFQERDKAREEVGKLFMKRCNIPIMLMVSTCCINHMVLQKVDLAALLLLLGRCFLWLGGVSGQQTHSFPRCVVLCIAVIVLVEG
jgi:hypothetical protein